MLWSRLLLGNHNLRAMRTSGFRTSQTTNLGMKEMKKRYKFRKRDIRRHIVIGDDCIL